MHFLLPATAFQGVLAKNSVWRGQESMDTSKPPTPENRRVTSRVVQNLKGEDAEGAPAGANPGWVQGEIEFQNINCRKGP